MLAELLLQSPHHYPLAPAPSSHPLRCGAATLRSSLQVNQMIQKAARLRMGSHKMRLVSDARAAIKSNSIQKLFRIIERGVAE